MKVTESIRALERLYETRAERNAARTEFEADANDLTAEWVRDAEIRYEDALAIAQEWSR